MYRAFTVTECPRCPDLILVGVVAGIRYRIDRRTVPVADAAVLRRYGTPVLVLDRRPSGFHAEWWETHHDLSRPDRHLVVPHVCNSAHASRPVARATTPPTVAAVTGDRPPY